MGMTNKEKFIEVFNQEPDDTVCPIFCSSSGKKCPLYGSFKYGRCEAGDWWNGEYKESHKADRSEKDD